LLFSDDEDDEAAMASASADRTELVWWLEKDEAEAASLFSIVLFCCDCVGMDTVDIFLFSFFSSSFFRSIFATLFPFTFSVRIEE